MHDRQNLRFCSSSHGVRLTYATVRSGPPLVKAANWLSQLEFDWRSPIWRHWIEGLSRRHAYIRYDTRGCGLSDRDPPVTALAPQVSCPTLVMHGRNDARVPFEEGRLFASLIPGARFVPLESRNHILLENEPAWPRFIEEIEAFLPGGSGGGAFPELTARERELLEYLARGLDNHQIAAHLALSEKTVRNMVSSILAKLELELESRSAVIVHARMAGFGVNSPA